MKKTNKKGLTLIETIIAVGILTTILALLPISITRSERNTRLSAVAHKISSTIYQAQNYSMQGRSIDQQNSSAFGVRLENNRYIFFAGSAYNPSDPNNQIYNLPQGTNISQINLPLQSIAFQPLSGEIINYDPLQNSFSLNFSKTNISQKYSINKLGILSKEAP